MLVRGAAIGAPGFWGRALMVDVVPPVPKRYPLKAVEVIYFRFSTRRLALARATSKTIR